MSAARAGGAAARWAGWALLFALLVVEIARRGPLTLRRPATVLSNGVPVQRTTQPYLVFLDEVRRRLPRGATVAVVHAESPSPMPYLIAIGQLPDQTVLPPEAIGTDRPEWVAAFGRAFSESGFRPVGTFSGGTLLRRSQ